MTLPEEDLEFSNLLNDHFIVAFLLPVCFAATAIATKLLTRKVSLTCILFWLVIMQTVFSLTFAGYDFHIKIPTKTDLPLLLVVSVTGLTAHLCMTKAFSLAPVSVVRPSSSFRFSIDADWQRSSGRGFARLEDLVMYH